MDQLSEERLLDWWAFGLMNDWFPAARENGRRAMSPEKALEVLQTFGRFN